MKTINVVFEDDEFKRLEEAKKNRTWHDFILQLINDKKNINDKGKRNEE
jgi:predicted CopG family antitoxin